VRTLSDQPEEFGQFIRAEIAKWAKVVAQAGLKGNERDRRGVGREHNRGAGTAGSPAAFAHGWMHTLCDF